MAESNNIIGKVASVLGQAFATGPDGTARQLKVGDPVFEGDVVQATQGGHVELAFRDGSAYFARDNESVTLDSQVFGDGVGQIGNIVGKVTLVEGQVFAKGPDGAVRQLRVGDPVYEGEVIQTSLNSRVELSFDNGSTYFLRDKESVTLDGMVFGDRAADARESALMPGRDGELENLARALAQGNSLDQLLDETAAGRSSLFGGANDGHSFVQLLRIAETIDPLGYQFGTKDVVRVEEIVEEAAKTTVNTLAVTVNAVVDLTAGNDSATTDEDVAIIGGSVAGNDSTTSGGALSFAKTTDPSHGTVAMAGNGTYTYTPVGDYSGADSFTYTVTDAASGESATRTVNLTINPVSDAPSLAVSAASGDEDTAIALSITTAQSDVDASEV